jgi:adiponectin receptor
MFVGMGLSAIFPVLDGLVLYGFGQMRKQIGLLWLVLQGALYILGASLYAVSSGPDSVIKLIDFQARWPERWRPGKHDLLGSSHQIFHVLIVLAALSHLVGLLKAFDYRHGPNGATCKVES